MSRDGGLSPGVTGRAEGDGSLLVAVTGDTLASQLRVVVGVR